MLTIYFDDKCRAQGVIGNDSASYSETIEKFKILRYKIFKLPETVSSYNEIFPNDDASILIRKPYISITYGVHNGELVYLPASGITEWWVSTDAYFIINIIPGSNPAPDDDWKKITNTPYEDVVEKVKKTFDARYKRLLVNRARARMMETFSKGLDNYTLAMAKKMIVSKLTKKDKDEYKAVVELSDKIIEMFKNLKMVVEKTDDISMWDMAKDRFDAVVDMYSSLGVKFGMEFYNKGIRELDIEKYKITEEELKPKTVEIDLEG